MLEERERYQEEMLNFRNVKKHELYFYMKNLHLVSASCIFTC
jgi:hypothetical protein